MYDHLIKPCRHLKFKRFAFICDFCFVESFILSNFYFLFYKTALPVRVMKLIGIEYLLATNAAGGINTKFQVEFPIRKCAKKRAKNLICSWLTYLNKFKIYLFACQIVLLEQQIIF